MTFTERRVLLENLHDIDNALLEVIDKVENIFYEAKPNSRDRVIAMSLGAALTGYEQFVSQRIEELTNIEELPA